VAKLGLVLDISFAGFAAWVDVDDKVLAHRWRAPGERYDDVAAWIEDCLKEARGGFSHLDWVAVNVGPGSFTGIRIAMAFAQGLAMPRNLPLYGFTSFAPMLLSYTPEKKGERFVFAIPANSGRFYVSMDLEDSGALMEGEEFLRLADPKTTLILPAKTPAMETVLAKFNHVEVLEDRWNVQRLVQHARTSGLDAMRPYYLQLSAAEEKTLG
jgi:tRNA threonylcarbamoyl adenosine modification protein YeaZ